MFKFALQKHKFGKFRELTNERQRPKTTPTNPTLVFSHPLTSHPTRVLVLWTMTGWVKWLSVAANGSVLSVVRFSLVFFWKVTREFYYHFWATTYIPLCFHITYHRSTPRLVSLPRFLSQTERERSRSIILDLRWFSFISSTWAIVLGF